MRAGALNILREICSYRYLPAYIDGCTIFSKRAIFNFYCLSGLPAVGFMRQVNTTLYG